MKIALALGSGGARGYAHIGVIAELEARGMEVVAIAGTSMGALVGGVYAAGRLGEYAEWATSLTQREVLRLLDPSLTAPGAIRAEKIMAQVRRLLDGVAIEDLPVPYTAVATDLLAQKEVWFGSGPLDVAIRASIAIPSVITPAEVDGRLLVDGGLLNPLPLAPLAPARADAVVAVSLSGPRATPTRRPPAPRREPWSAVSRRIRAEVRRGGRPAPAEASVDVAVDALAGVRRFDVVDLSLRAMQELIARYRLSSYPPDVLIEVPGDACGTLDFHRAAELVALGRDLAGPALDRLADTEPRALPAQGGPPHRGDR